MLSWFFSLLLESVEDTGVDLGPVLECDVTEFLPPPYHFFSHSAVSHLITCRVWFSTSQMLTAGNPYGHSV